MIYRTIAILFVCLGTIAAQDIDSDVEKILRERLALLQEAAELQREAYRNGTASFTSTLATDRAVLEAELELAKNAADRVRVREQMLKVAESLEQATEQLAKANEAPRMDLLSARANRLRAAADLMLERKAAEVK